MEVLLAIAVVVLAALVLDTRRKVRTLMGQKFQDVSAAQDGLDQDIAAAAARSGGGMTDAEADEVVARVNAERTAVQAIASPAPMRTPAAGS